MLADCRGGDHRNPDRDYDRPARASAAAMIADSATLFLPPRFFVALGGKA